MIDKSMKTNHIQHLFFDFFLSLFATMANAQEADYINFNGWDFIPWSLSKNQVEDTLRKRNITFDPGNLNQKEGPTTTFVFQNMKTRLAYDSGHLYDVQQYQYFGVDEKEKADSAFIRIKKTLVKQYGKPKIIKYDENGNTMHIKWELRYTVVVLYYYSENNKLLTDFENQTYQIFLHTNPK